MNETLDLIEPVRHTGSETLPNGATLLNFWQWMGSNLVSNALRGTFGEYLVALAVGAAQGVQDEWADYDVLTPDGNRVEVKTSGCIQTWRQTGLSVPTFNIGRTQSWDPKTNIWNKAETRQSDAYVFCLHHHQSQSTIDPLDMSQWTFYVLPTADLNRAVGDQRTIRASRLTEIGAVTVAFDGIKDAIDAVVAGK